MKIKVEPDANVLELTDREMGIICNAFNEVCNGLDIRDFTTRLGATHDEVYSLFQGLIHAKQEHVAAMKNKTT